MFCSKCGSKNDDNAAFCGACGAKLNSPQAAQAGQAAGSAAAQQVAATSIVTTTATGSVTTGDGSTAAAAKKTGKIIGSIFAIVVIALIIATIVTGGFGLMGSSVKESVNDYSWEELSNISAEISGASDEAGAIEIAKKYNLCTQSGKLDGNQIKSITLSNGTEVDAQIVGFNHDDKTDGGKAGITFIFKNTIAEHEMNSSNTNSGGWKDSDMRSWLASDGMNMLPDDLKNSLIEVYKLTNNVGETKSKTSVTNTSDKLWLYSLTELAGKITLSDYPEEFDYSIDIFNAEGSQYKLYRDMQIDVNQSNEILDKSFDGDTCMWWGRTPIPATNYRFMSTRLQCNPGSSSDATYSDGVVPGFCI